VPVLETPDGKPVGVTPVDADAINARFDSAMNDDGPDTQAPPKRQPGDGGGEPRPRRQRQAREDKSRTTAKPAAAALDDKARAEGVQGWAQIGAGIAMMLGKATKNEAYQADAITIASNAGQFADAAVQIAHADAAFAARLDRVCAVGPYGALIAVGVGVVSQCVRNHRPAAAIPGTVHPSELLAAEAAA
jgi:hypothetical protein